MKKIWKFIVDNRIYVVLFVFVVFFVFVVMTMKAYLYPDDKLAVYGDRLEGIMDVEITNDKKDEVIKYIKEDDNVNDVSIQIQGKIVNISIKVSDKKSTMDIMKEKCTEIVNKFSSDEIGYYDFQIFVKNEDANYNMIGYKNKKNNDLSWVSDVIVSEVENDEEKQ